MNDNRAPAGLSLDEISDQIAALSPRARAKVTAFMVIRLAVDDALQHGRKRDEQRNAISVALDFLCHVCVKQTLSDALDVLTQPLTQDELTPEGFYLQFRQISEELCDVAEMRGKQADQTLSQMKRIAELLAISGDKS